MSKKKRYALRTPLTVKGGIRSQNAHSGPLRAWWSRRWTEVIERFRLGARLGRGRNYAVSGQVSQLEIAPGMITAQVQGANKEPYASSIRFRTVAEDAKAGLIAALRAQPMLVARLLVAELPLEVEGLFRAAGCPLFPQRENDLTSRCSCPDYANPCKHLAAIYYLLGEAITKNPLLLLGVRGISRAELLGDAALTAPAPAATARPDAPASVDLAGFYGSPHPPFEDFGTAVKALTHAPLIYRLGPLPFWRGQERFSDTLEHLYARAAARGWAVWAGEPLDLRREDEKVIITGANLHLKGRRMRVDTTFS
ncbi:MAG: SWIM zinc finger family protein [Kiritimatiellia bacterium]|jgi:uncharacterized Zn finger protein|nr:SWIM zinc finger family protein [Kiritimatiellia bacterium]MDX9792209.1 SWIM zinc finger family protein [Kiritimatiellia bacterium]